MKLIPAFRFDSGKIDILPTIMAYFVSGILVFMVTMLSHANANQNKYTEAGQKTCHPLLTASNYTDLLTGKHMVVCADNSIREVK